MRLPVFGSLPFAISPSMMQACFLAESRDISLHLPMVIRRLAPATFFSKMYDFDFLVTRTANPGTSSSR